MGNSRPWAQTFLLRSLIGLVLAIVGGAFFWAPALAAVAVTPPMAYVQVVAGSTAEQTFFVTRSDVSKKEHFTVYVDQPAFISLSQTSITLEEGEATAAIHVIVDATESPDLGIYDRVIYIVPLSDRGELLDTYYIGRLRFSVLSSTSHPEASAPIDIRAEDVLVMKEGLNVNISFNLYNSGLDDETNVSYILRVYAQDGTLLQETDPSSPQAFSPAERAGYTEHLDFLLPGEYTYALFTVSPGGQEIEIYRNVFMLTSDFAAVMRQIISIIGIILIFIGLYVLARARITEQSTL